MTELAKVVALSGALDPEMLRELVRWRLPIEVPEEAPFTSPEEAVAAIEEAQQDRDLVQVRATELDAVQQFNRTKQKAKLHLVAGGESGTYDILCGLNDKDEYIIPWQSDSIVDILTNGESYLIDGRKKVYFADVVELYFGKKKAFVLCTPIREAHGKPSHKS